MRKKKVLMQAHQSNKKKIELMIQREKKELKQLINDKKDLSEALNTKADTLREKTKEI